MKPACAILSGGKNSRMGGENKAFLTLDENTFIERTVNNLEKIFDEIIIVTHSPNEYCYQKNKCVVITDLIKEIGPLGGIYSALSYTDNDSVFFVPCDMPHLNNSLIEKEISVFNDIEFDALVPRVGKWLQPLHSIFKKKLTHQLHSFIMSTQKYQIRNFLDIIRVQYFELEDNCINRKVFTNINTPEDLGELRKFHFENSRKYKQTK